MGENVNPYFSSFFSVLFVAAVNDRLPKQWNVTFLSLNKKVTKEISWGKRWP